ncbi:zinc ribbon domain-containing protein [Corynebacterium pseudodiphtheriticum]|uniref:zinc ribbon domain-containing protein n=1 Tax=Corynebacterium pseudodiphtheriticum TaxID=37637 RepID=UPI00254BE0C4|nr:zinc ribbon domain-containing protein [Corynebacterium pseudodiphtheriticum]MDK8683471.1 zinc ribbon domain-containing protein [Corynebacterium pseudodiphtheriticum]
MGLRPSRTRRPATGRHSSSRQRTFSGKIRCAQCGAWYGSKTWHADTKYEKRIWRCNHKYAGGTPCATPHVSDEQITAAFLDAVHHLLASRDQVDELVDKAVRAELDTTDLHIEADQLFARVGAAAETIDALITRNALVDHAEVSVDGTITFTFTDGRSQAISFKK